MALFVESAGVGESILGAEGIERSFHSLGGGSEVEILRRGFRDMQKGARVGAQGDIEDLRFRRKTHARNVVTPDIGGEQLPGIAAEGEASRHAARVEVAQADLLVIFEVAVLEVECMNE